MKERENSVLPQPSDTKHQSLGCSEAGTSCGLAHFPVSCGSLQSSYYHQHDTYIPLQNRQSTGACLVTRQTKVASLPNNFIPMDITQLTQCIQTGCIVL